jgi:cytochrome c-type biogenesis protein CcmE
MRFAISIFALPLCAAAALSACGPPPYEMQLPQAFKQFEESRDYKLITADGVMLKAREVENYPEAGLEFWTDALQRHLEEQGYVVKSQDCFETTRGLDACTLDFMLPHGAEDWVLSVTLFVVEDEIILVEVAGPYDRFATIEDELDKAIKTFDLGKIVAIALSVIVVGGGLVYLVLSSVGESMVYYKTVEELLAERGRFEGREVRVNGQLVEGSLARKAGTDEFRFELVKNGKVIEVRYSGIIPDSMARSSEILVQGTLAAGRDELAASEIMTKCPSKYEDRARGKNTGPDD